MNHFTNLKPLILLELTNRKVVFMFLEENFNNTKEISPKLEKKLKSLKHRLHVKCTPNLHHLTFEAHFSEKLVFFNLFSF